MSLYSINMIMLLGLVGKIQEFKTQSGTAFCKISLVTSESTKKEGEWVEEAEWHNICVFGKTAEMCLKNINKGNKIFIEGKIKTKKYQDKNNETKYTTEIIAESVKFVEPKKTEYTSAEEKKYEVASNNDNDDNDDLPF